MKSSAVWAPSELLLERAPGAARSRGARPPRATAPWCRSSSATGPARRPPRGRRGRRSSPRCRAWRRCARIASMMRWAFSPDSDCRRRLSLRGDSHPRPRLLNLPCALPREAGRSSGRRSRPRARPRRHRGGAVVELLLGTEQQVEHLRAQSLLSTIASIPATSSRNSSLPTPPPRTPPWPHRPSSSCGSRRSPDLCPCSSLPSWHRLRLGTVVGVYPIYPPLVPTFQARTSALRAAG